MTLIARLRQRMADARDPADIERLQRLLDFFTVTKHMGPGNHPSGSPQDVHGKPGPLTQPDVSRRAVSTLEPAAVVRGRSAEARDEKLKALDAYFATWHQTPEGQAILDEMLRRIVGSDSLSEGPDQVTTDDLLASHLKAGLDRSSPEAVDKIVGGVGRHSLLQTETIGNLRVRFECVDEERARKVLTDLMSSEKGKRLIAAAAPEDGSLLLRFVDDGSLGSSAGLFQPHYDARLMPGYQSYNVVSIAMGDLPEWMGESDEQPLDNVLAHELGHAADYWAGFYPDHYVSPWDASQRKKDGSRDSFSQGPMDPRREEMTRSQYAVEVAVKQTLQKEHWGSVYSGLSSVYYSELTKKQQEEWAYARYNRQIGGPVEQETFADAVRFWYEGKEARLRAATKTIETARRRPLPIVERINEKGETEYRYAHGGTPYHPIPVNFLTELIESAITTASSRKRPPVKYPPRDYRPEWANIVQGWKGHT